MDILFGSTAVIEETAHTSNTRGWFKTTLSFFIILLGGLFLSNIMLRGITYIPLYTNDEYVSLIMSGNYDQDTLEALLTKIFGELPWLGAAELIATICTIFVVIFFALKYDGRRIFSLGLVKKGFFKEYLAGLGIGFGMFTVVTAIIFLAGDATIIGFGNISPLLLLYFIGFLIQGFSEEILLRGYYFVTLASKGNIALAIFISSTMFSFMHAGNNGINIIGYMNIFLFGFFAALYFLRRGSIWGISAIHSIWNFAQANIFGFRVSGNALECSIFNIKYTSTSPIFNGGNFGPEGGIAVTIVLFIGIIVLLFFKNKEVETPLNFKGEFFTA